MSKRPPQRPIPRETASTDTPAQGFAPFLVDDGPAPAATAATPAEAPASTHPVATSREELLDTLGGLRAQGHLDVGDEAAILREYDGLLVELRGEKARLEAEYRERMARDGQARTDAWLAEAAAALGRRQGEQMRQLVQTIPGLMPASA